MDFKFKEELVIQHPNQVVSFAHIDSDTRDLYTYYFHIENGKIKLHSIDKWAKNGKSGNTYKHEEIYHFEYKKTITNHVTGEFKEPEVPDYLWNAARFYFIGYVIDSL
jgi:hypothetical protein